MKKMEPKRSKRLNDDGRHHFDRDHFYVALLVAELTLTGKDTDLNGLTLQRQEGCCTAEQLSRNA